MTVKTTLIMEIDLEDNNLSNNAKELAAMILARQKTLRVSRWALDFEDLIISSTTIEEPEGARIILEE